MAAYIITTRVYFLAGSAPTASPAPTRRSICALELASPPAIRRPTRWPCGPESN